MNRSLPQKLSDKLPGRHQEQELIHLERPPEPPSCMGCVLAGCLLSSIVLVGIALAIFTVIRNPCAVLPGPARRILDCGPIEIKVRKPVITEIRKLERLDMVELNLSAIVTVKQEHTFPPYTEILVYGVCGRAIVGVDLAKLQDSDLIVNGSTITVTLPPSEVFSVDPTLSLNVSATDVRLIEGNSDRKAKILQPCNHTFHWTRVGHGTAELVEDAQRQAMVQFWARAEQEDILERAQDNAKKELARFLLFAGYQEVIFLEPTEAPRPPGLFERLGQSWGQIEEIPTPQPEAEP